MTNNANGSKVTTQVVWLSFIAVAGLVCMVLGLAVWANWSDGAVVGMLSAFGTMAVGVIVAIRNQQRQAEMLDQVARSIGAGQRSQEAQLQTIKKQTNAIAGEERAAIAEQAAAKAVEKVVGQ